MKYWLPFCILFLAIALILSIAVGTLDTPDSFMYHVMGNYLLRHEVIPVSPYNDTIVQTLFGPVYSIFVEITTNLPTPLGSFIVPLLQLISIGIASGIIAIITKSFLPKVYAFLAAMIFILLPYQYIYATVLMSETLSAFFMTIYLWIVFDMLKHKRIVAIGFLAILAAILTLTRYMFSALWIVTIILGGIFVLKKIIHKTLKKETIAASMGIIISILMIGAWVQFNHQLYGTWGLSIVSGRHLYNNVITKGHILPGEQDPLLIEYRRRVPEHRIYNPWWDTHLLFADLPEAAVDQFYMQLSLHAIAAHPLAYALNVADSMIKIPFTPPYLREETIPALAACSAQCRIPWNYTLCVAAIPMCSVQQLWSNVMHVSKSIYVVLMLPVVMLSLIGICFMLASRKPFFLCLIGLFFLLYGFAAATEWVEGRFLIPLFPMVTIFVTYALFRCIRFCKQHLFKKQ